MRPFTAKEVPFCLQQWNQVCPDRFELDEQILLRKTAGSGLFVPEASFVSDDGFVACKWANDPDDFSKPNTKRLHIAVITHPLLIEWVVDMAADLGAESIVFGAGLDHIFPGLPLVPGWKLGEDLASAMTWAGFASGSDRAWDVERDLAGYEPYEGCLEALEREGIECRTAEQEDEEALDAFFLSTFPLRWRFDVMRKMREGEGRQIDILVKDGETLGFSCTQDASSVNPIGGAVWRPSLGEGWRALGPIGISEKIRGRKLGGALLGASLLRMAREGGRQAIIDWTSLLDFYGMHGFKPARQYQHWTREPA